MKYQDLILNSPAFKELLKDATGQGLSHAYLFISPDTLTLEGLTHFFIAAALSGGENTFRKVLQDKSADVLYYPPENDGKVLTEHIESLLENVYLTPIEEKYKFFVIRRAETMPEAAQNKLLKTLEEPPAHSIMILQCANANLMLPTVKSRCRSIAPQGYDAMSIEKELAKYYPAQGLRVAAAACRGSLERAEELLSNDTYTKLFSAVIECLTYMKKSPDILKYSFIFLSYKDHLADALELFELVLRDCMIVKHQPLNVSFSGSLTEIKRISEEYMEAALVGAMKAVYRAKERLSRYGNAASIIDEFLFSLLEEKVKCLRL